MRVTLINEKNYINEYLSPNIAIVSNEDRPHSIITGQTKSFTDGYGELSSFYGYQNLMISSTL